MLSSGRLQRYGICILLLGVLLALYGCEGDPQAKKARYIQKGLAYNREEICGSRPGVQECRTA